MTDSNRNSRARRLPLPNWRKASWAIAIWSIFMAWWIVAGAGSTGHVCDGSTYLEACKAGATVGTGLAVGMLFMLWFVGLHRRRGRLVRQPTLGQHGRLRTRRPAGHRHRARGAAPRCQWLDLSARRRYANQPFQNVLVVVSRTLPCGRR